MSLTQSSTFYLGTMTGTSMDGMDIVAVSFDSQDRPQLHFHDNIEYPEDLRTSLQEIAVNPDANISTMCELDNRLGQFYAAAINQFIHRFQLDKNHIAAVGSHGQTIRHDPEGKYPYTLQIGDPNVIAARTGLTTVADFRRRDIALGGQGAPLAPAFHNQVFRAAHSYRAIINIGGIANITGLPGDPSLPVIGFDSGPGNTLIDSVCRQLLDSHYDNNGSFAKLGNIHLDKLQNLIENEPYFHKLPAKTTGTDYFSPAWLQQTDLNTLPPYDLIATLTELTALTITHGLTLLPDEVDECFICGGGAHNNFLVNRLRHHLSAVPVSSTRQLGIDPDWVEAMAFAWLARQTLNQKPGNLPSVTNAQKLTILGSICYSNGKS